MDMHHFLVMITVCLLCYNSDEILEHMLGPSGYKPPARPSPGVRMHYVCTMFTCIGVQKTLT